MKHNLLTFSLSVIVLLIGCSNGKTDPKKLVGKYCFNKDQNDSIFLYTDNKYTHKFITNEGKIYEASGVWKYDSLENEIKFEDFVFFNNEGSDNPPGLWYSKINEHGDSEVRLMYSSENNIYYYKE